MGELIQTGAELIWPPGELLPPPSELIRPRYAGADYAYLKPNMRQGRARMTNTEKMNLSLYVHELNTLTASSYGQK